MKMLVVRIGFVLFVSLNVVCFYWASMPANPVRTTLGSLAEKNADFRYRSVILTNSIMGERNGRFIRFKSTVNYRHDVVLVLMAPDMTPNDCVIYSGYCYGLWEEEYQDCPFPAPFILVEYAKPSQ